MKDCRWQEIKNIFTWLNDLARWIFNQQLTSIQVCDGDLEATQSFDKANALDHVKVTAITSELLFRLKPNVFQFDLLAKIYQREQWSFNFKTFSSSKGQL